MNVTSISQLVSFILPAYYLIVIGLNTYIFFGRNKKLENKVPFIIISLICLHIFHLVFRGIAVGDFPVATKMDALSLLALAVICLILIIELSSENKSAILFAVILSFIIQTISSLFYSWSILPHPLLQNPLYIVHVFMTIMGYSAISISALYALLYILLNHHIKYHRLGVIYEKLPPLRNLEKLSIRSVQIGVITLGIGILIGHFQAKDALGTYWPMDPKVIYNNIIWFCYFLGLIIAQMYKWRGRWMAYLAIVGFGILIFTNIMIIFIDQTFHQFQ
jgi:HemX protein